MSIQTDPIAATPAALATTTSVTTTTTTHAPPPPELEQTLSLLLSKRSVLGVLLLSRSSPPSIIRHSGVVFEGEQGKKYAKAVGKIVDACKVGLEDVAGGEGVSSLLSLDRTLVTLFTQDDIRFLRLRTKRHELMVSPGQHLVFAVVVAG